MRDGDDGSVEGGDQAFEQRAADGVEVRLRLVEQEHVGILGEAGGRRPREARPARRPPPRRRRHPHRHDPTTAYQHTLAARARAARLAVVREACGEAAYAAGEYAEALSELRAAKRINGTTAYLPIMADCERALGRPERALALAKSPAVANFDPATKAEMTIVEAGARRDLGEYDAALRTLRTPPSTTRPAPPGSSACATPTPTPSSPPAAPPTPSNGSTAPKPSTPTKPPTPPPAPTTIEKTLDQT